MVLVWRKGGDEDGTESGKAGWFAAQIDKAVRPLSGDAEVAGGVGAVVAGEEGGASGDGGDPLLVRVGGEPERWALVAPVGRAVRVNGVRLSSGIRILRDRDLIEADGTMRCFSSERVAFVEAFAGAGGATDCGRCQVAFQEGEEVVRCPGCAVLYHQNAKRSCWQYRDGRCLFCEHPATLDGQLQWTPQEI